MKLTTIIERAGDLPTLPMVAARINRELRNQSLDAGLLGKIISEDSSLSAKILKLANSAFYGMPKQVTSIDRAVMILGFDTIKNLALSISIYTLFQKKQQVGIDVHGLWNHGLGCALCSQELMRKNNVKLCDDAFLSGIIHDIGKILLIQNCLADMEKILQLVREKNISINEAELEVLGFTHQNAGGMLLKEWNFPERLVAGVMMHHELPPETSSLDNETALLVNCLCVGNQMAKSLSLGKSTDPRYLPIPMALWETLHCNQEDLPILKTRATENYTALLESWDVH